MAALAALGALGLALLLASPVQGWLVRRLVAEQSGWHLDFDRIGLGPTGLDATGLRFSMPGLTASSAPLSIRLVPTRALSAGELRVERVDVHKIRVIVTPAQLAPSPSANPEPFSGVLRLLQAPIPWALDGADLEGEIVVQDVGQSRVQGTFRLTGGGLAGGHAGDFDYEIALDAKGLPAGAPNRYRSKGKIHVTQNLDHGIARIEVEGDLRMPESFGPKLPVGQLKLVVAATPRGETYSASLRLGDRTELALAADIDGRRCKLKGRLDGSVDQSLAAVLTDHRLPAAKATGSVTFDLDTRTGDLQAAVGANWAASGWEAMLPQLAGIDSFHGQVAATVARQDHRLRLLSLQADAHGDHTPASISLELRQPVDWEAIPTTPLADLRLEHWPLGWVNPWLVASGTQLAPAELEGAWEVARAGTKGIGLTSVAPLTVGPLALAGRDLPPLILSLRPKITATREEVALTMGDIVAVTAAGDRLSGEVSLVRTAATGAIHATGNLEGALPTLAKVGRAPAGCSFGAAWDATLTGDRIHVGQLKFAGRAGRAEPCLTLELLQPFDAELAGKRLLRPLNLVAGAEASPDLVRLQVKELPLGWLSGWLPGRTVSGIWHAGESRLALGAQGGVLLHTPTAWHLDGVGVDRRDGPAAPRWAIRMKPSLAVTAERISTDVTDFVATDREANAVSGRVAAAGGWNGQDLATTLDLTAKLPALPHSAGTFGAVAATLQAKLHSVTPRLLEGDLLDLRVTNAQGELLSLHAPRPFICGLSNSNLAVFSTLEPLHVAVAGFPLRWLRPWSGALDLDGTVAPFELELAAKNEHLFARATGPVKVTGLTAKRQGQDLVHGADVAFAPGLDLTVICVPRPTFQLAYTGMVHANDLHLEVSGKRAMDLDLGVAFKGNGPVNLPDQIDLVTRLDLAAWPGLGAFGLPPAGRLVARLNGDLLGAEPVELWARLNGVPGAKPANPLPPLELTLQGKLSRDEVFAGSVKLLVDAAPRPTDLTFAANLDLAAGVLNVASGLHSHYVDGQALLAWSRAFSSPPRVAKAKPKPVGPAVTAVTHSASEDALPFWGKLRGSFDLDLGTVEFSPYRIDHVRGRLDATAATLSLHDLGGEMFAGRWGGGVRIEHQPDNTTGEHTLSGDFRIEQFESARVVQTVFPNQLANLDARINVRAAVRSHGNSLVSLVDQATADFSVDGEKGVLRLTVPKADLLSTAAVFGGTILLSPELRALGRLLKKFSEMPVDQIRIAGRRDAQGRVTVDDLTLASPSLRLVGRGGVAPAGEEPLMKRPLELSLQLEAKDDFGVILGGMGLLERKRGADGFRPMRVPFRIGGEVGAPDTAPLYDLLAQGVSGSHGTWGFLMRKVQAEILKKTRLAHAAP